LVTSLVPVPICKSVSLQFLIAHAEQPNLLQSAGDPFLREFAQRGSFYDEFIALVAQRVPAYTEEKLLNTKTFLPQQDYQRILDCFKEISGIRNPFHYRELGRVIPAVGDALSQLASTAAGPEWVIELSPRYNADLNNDQKIVVERIELSGFKVHAAIQHYFLPRSPDHPPYFEMVTAALGYWEGIPLIWGYPLFGETVLREVQLSLEELIKRDYAYLHLPYQENDDTILLNQKPVAKIFSLKDNPQKILGYSPQEEYLSKELSSYHPSELSEDLTLDGITFAKGTRFGMPCNRYEVTLPTVGVGRRLLYAAGAAWRSLFNKDAAYRILVRRPPEVVISESLYATQHEAMQRVQAIADAEKARADTAEAKLTLEQKVSAVNKVFGEMRAQAHDTINHALVTKADTATLFRETLFLHSQYVVPIDNHAAMVQIFQDMAAPPDLRRIAAYTKGTIETMNAIIENERNNMRGGIPIKIETLSGASVLTPIVHSVARVYPHVGIEYVPTDILMRGDLHLLKVAFTNLIKNAVEASLPLGKIEITERKTRRAQRDFTIIDIFQSGYLSPENAAKLNSREAFSTKSDGNGQGAVASYNIIRDHHRGSIEYFSRGEQRAKVRVIF